MPRILKIALISFLSVVAAIVLVASILIWIVFTPARLTPIVRTQMSNYITCKSEIGAVELTFFSTFPEFGLKIDDLSLINPVPGNDTDTLLNAQESTATIDIAALWNNNELIIHSIGLENVLMNGFVDETGKANFDITKSDSKDTTAFENPFSKIDISNLSLKNAQIRYSDLEKKMNAKFENVNGKFSIKMQKQLLDALLDFSCQSADFRFDTINYLTKARVVANLPLQYSFDKSLLKLSKAKIDLNDLLLTMNGNVEMQPNNNILTDIFFNTDNYQLDPFLKLIPTVYTKSLEGIKMDGIFSTTGAIKGIYNDSVMPVISTNVLLEKGQFEYAGLPYKLTEMEGNADVNVDMNDEKASNIRINNMNFRTGQSTIAGNGSVGTILSDDMFIDLNLTMALNLEELVPMFPEDMPIAMNGFASGSGIVQFLLSDAMNKDIKKMKIAGDFDVSKFVMRYDSIALNTEHSKLNIQMPNPAVKKTGFMLANLWSDKLNFRKGKNLYADFRNSDMKVETTDIMQFEKMNTIDCKFRFDQMATGMDDMFAHLEKSTGLVSTKMNFSDSVAMPEVVCDFDVSEMVGTMDSMSLKMKLPKGNFSMKGDKSNVDKMIFNVLLNSAQTSADMGTQSIQASQFHINSTIDYLGNETNSLLQWIPTGSIALSNGKIMVDNLNADIEVPEIKFDFTPDEYNIKSSKFIVDNSDFQLTGKLWNVSDYFRDKGLLKGEFNFVSDKTDVYRLLDLTNGFGVEDSISMADLSAESTTEETSTGPYMVPKGMDVILHAKINDVALGYDNAKNLLGDLYVKDGLLVLQDMRFTTSAARMQLTAMYKTPRKNHLFMGMDFHVMDMEIGEMLKMIPDIDTIMPMLRSFAGKGEFHIAVETYMDSMYNLKKSTLRGVSSIKGENLVLMDGETFTEIAKVLRFNKKTENKVDSLSAEFTIFKNEVDIYPFLIVMDKYKAVVAGRHNLDMNFDYHISITDSPFPIKFGVDVKGSIDDMKIRPAKCRYANLYRPAQRTELDTKKLEIRKLIRDALKREVVDQ